MRKLMLASTVLLMVVGQAMAQTPTSVSMELEIGGNNNGATCTNRVMFTPGSNADGTVVQLDANQHVTWAVRVHVSGTHLKDGDQNSGDGIPDVPNVWLETRGISNFVFDLELHRDSAAGPLVTEATFTSTANAGGGCGSESDPLQNPTAGFLSNAAFPYTFAIGGYGPARIFDVYKTSTSQVGGPRSEVHCYPKAATGTGKLFGIGAGYASWTRVGLGQITNTWGGIGKGDAPTYPKPNISGCVGDPTQGCFGWGPVAEGQIENLLPGTYVLKLIPGGGINTLRGELGNVSRAVFARAADSASGDEITFVVEAVVPTTEVVGWKSVKTHSTSAPQEFAITLIHTTGSNATTEPRSGRTGDPQGIEKIVMTTTGDAPVLVSTLPTTWGTPAMTVTGAGVTGADVWVTLSGCVDRTCYDFDASQIISNLADPAADSATCKVVALIGDANNGRTVTTTDYNVVKGALNQTVTDANCRADLNCGKTITTTDYNVVKGKLNSTSVGCVN
jgi:hypothetical protein